MGSVPPSSEPAGAPRRRGRPRSTDIDDRVLRAARAIELEVGYDATTVEAIAGQAGVTKTTIYRRWPNKGVLLYEARFGPVDQHPGVPDTGDLRADLLAVLRDNASALRSDAVRGLVAALSSEALTDERVAEALRTRFFGPRADAITQRVETAVARREVRATIDASMVPALLTGPLQYLWVVRDSALDDDDLARIVDAVVGPHLPRRRARPADPEPPDG
jgi:AcrR family transcriptional regulator